MSIGNLRDNGNKSNNFPYQLRNLQLLGAIQECCAATGLSLSQLITLATAINNNTANLDVPLSTRATESTLSTLNSKFVNGTDIGDVTINNAGGASAVNIQDGGNSITVDGSVNILSLPAITGTVTVNQGTSPWIVSGTGTQRTPNILRVSGVNGSTPAGVYSVAIASVGTENAIVNGKILKPGEDIDYDGGGINNTVGSLTYDTTTNAGAELLITYLS